MSTTGPAAAKPTGGSWAVPVVLSILATALLIAMAIAIVYAVVPLVT
jgi:hypothetical protein